MLTLTVLLFMGVFAVVLLAVLNRRALADLFSAARVQVGKAGRAARGADPLANYQQTIDDAADAIKNAKQRMQKVVAVINSVKRRVETTSQEKARLEARIKRVLAENDQSKAREYAVMLGEVETNLAENEKQLQYHEKEYTFFCDEINKQQKRVEKAERDAHGLGVRLEMSQANKELSEFRDNFSSSGDALKGLETEREAVLRQIDANNAVSQIEKDIGGKTSMVDDYELDQNIKADEILSRFKKE